MPILNINMGVIGESGVVPHEIYIETSDTLAVVTAPGYLNKAKQQGYDFSNNQLAHVYGSDFNGGNPGVLDFQVGIAADGVITLSGTSEGGVALPVTANHLAVFVDTSGKIGDDAATAINGGNIQAGLSGTAGYVASFPATASKGSLRLTAVANTGDTLVTISNAAHGQATVVSIPDGGQATTEFIIADSAGTQHITSGSLQVDAGNLSAGSSGAAGYVASFPATAAKGSLRLVGVANTGDTVTTISNAAMGQASVVSIPDPGAATANFLLDAGAANILTEQQVVSLADVLLTMGATYTMTRVAQGNYALVKSAADDTSGIAFDITPQIRTAASKGFRLDSFDLVYSIATDALDAHTVTLDRVTYENNAAVSVNAVAITGTLATATQAQPYVTNVTVDTPAFLITADSKYVLELNVDSKTATAYSLYGLVLRFSQTIA